MALITEDGFFSVNEMLRGEFPVTFDAIDPHSKAFQFEKLAFDTGRIVFPNGRRVIFTGSRCGNGYARFRHFDKCAGVHHEVEFKKKDQYAVVRYVTRRENNLAAPELREQVVVTRCGRAFVNGVIAFEKACRKTSPSVEALN